MDPIVYLFTLFKENFNTKKEKEFLGFAVRELDEFPERNWAFKETAASRRLLLRLLKNSLIDNPEMALDTDSNLWRIFVHNYPALKVESDAGQMSGKVLKEKLQGLLVAYED